MASQMGRGRGRKRAQPMIQTGISSSAKDRDSEYICPICFEFISEPYMTECGHSFCHKCLVPAIQAHHKCPHCLHPIQSSERIFPNFSLNEVIKRKKLESGSSVPQPARQADIKVDDVLKIHEDFNLVELSHLMQVLKNRKDQLEMISEAGQNKIVHEFLSKIKAKKEEDMRKLQMELAALNEDCADIEERLAGAPDIFAELMKLDGKQEPPEAGEGTSKSEPRDTAARVCPSHPDVPAFLPASSPYEGFNSIPKEEVTSQGFLSTKMTARRSMVERYSSDLEKVYFKMRCQEYASSSSLGDFSHHLSKFTRFTTTRTLATLNYSSDFFNNMSIVSSIEFDKDREFFACAGVTKKIKVFEYSSVIKDVIDVHYPVVEMVDTSKISSLTWSTYNKNVMASANYEGAVSLWDTTVGVKTQIFHEHGKRAWSVDFNKVDPGLMASGSDDTTVKLWSQQYPNSVAVIEAKANVCCVCFKPNSRYHLAFGSADHCVHYYDIRNTRKAVRIFKGHKKAVSYTKFLSDNEVISASTDSMLKLWNTEQSTAVRSFQGHMNEKNFVGLSGYGEYMACGSENNCVYIYYRGIATPMMHYKFDTVRAALERERRDEDSSEFVSSVCWRGTLNDSEPNVIIAANSQGTIKILELA